MVIQMAFGSFSKISRKHAILLLDTLNIFWSTEIPIRSGTGLTRLEEQFEQLGSWHIDPVDLDTSVWVPAGYRHATTPGHYNDFYLNTADLHFGDWAELLGLDPARDRGGQLLGDAFNKVTAEGWMGKGVQHNAKPECTLSDLIECIEDDSELADAYHPETLRATLQQLKFYSRSPFFADQGTDLRKLVRPGQLSVLQLSHLPDGVRAVLLSVLVKKLFQLRAEASEDAKRLDLTPDLPEDLRNAIVERLESSLPPCWIAVDEAQNVLPTGRSTAATNALIKLVREGRNFGLSFAITTQQPGAIDSRIMAQVDTFIVHRLAVRKDLAHVEQNLKADLPAHVKHGARELSFETMIRSLEVGQALVSNTETERCFFLNVRPRVSVHGGYER